MNANSAATSAPVNSDGFLDIRHLAAPVGDPTLRQVKRQVEGLGCAEFEIGVLPPKHRPDLKTKIIRTFSAVQLLAEKVIRWLKAMNAEGYDIYCRPAVLDQGMRHPLIFVDDLSAEQIEKMELAGLPVAVLVESSPANFHGWVRVGKYPISSEEALCSARTLAVLFGGDPAAVSSRQFGRLAGFTNKKSKHAVSGGAPFSMLRASTTEVAPDGPKFLEILRASMVKRANFIQAGQVSGDRRRAAAELGGEESDRAAAAFLQARAGIQVLRSDGTPDESAADYGAAAGMLNEGWQPGDVYRALLRASPNIETRHRDVVEYAARTVASAERAAATKRPSRIPVPVLRPRR
jgi:hypothetical protein